MAEENRDFWKALVGGSIGSLLTLVLGLAFTSWQWHRDQRLASLDATVGKATQALELAHRVTWFQFELGHARAADATITNSLAIGFAKDPYATARELRSASSFDSYRVPALLKRYEDDLSKLEVLLFEIAYVDGSAKALALHREVVRTTTPFLDALRTDAGSRTDANGDDLKTENGLVFKRYSDAVMALEDEVRDICVRSMERAHRYRDWHPLTVGLLVGLGGMALTLGGPSLLRRLRKSSR
jgi:hypothetical protein